MSNPVQVARIQLKSKFEKIEELYIFVAIIIFEYAPNEHII